MYFKSLMLLHLALLLGQVLFAGIILFLHSHDKEMAPLTKMPNEFYFYIALGLVFAVIVTSFYLYQAKVSRAKEKTGLFAILTEYRSAVLLRDTCLQGPSLLATIAFFLTGNDRYMALTGLIILVFLVWWPTPSKVIADLGLEGEYRSKLEEPDAILW
jgi:divalent metal cation (Fe/Co/Zn/Cd) transporter